jgi:hypothetical protein
MHSKFYPSMFQQFTAIIRGSYCPRSYSSNICVVGVYIFLFTKISNQNILHYPYELMRGSVWAVDKVTSSDATLEFSSSVHLLRNRLLGGGARIVAIRGFGCDFSIVCWVSMSSWKTVRTGGMRRSVCRVWLVTYHGVLASRALRPPDNGNDLLKHVGVKFWMYPWIILLLRRICWLLHNDMWDRVHSREALCNMPSPS